MTKKLTELEREIERIRHESSTDYTGYSIYTGEAGSWEALGLPQEVTTLVSQHQVKAYNAEGRLVGWIVDGIFHSAPPF